jgi:hypothetical protein
MNFIQKKFLLMKINNFFLPDLKIFTEVFEKKITFFCHFSDLMTLIHRKTS